MLIHLPVLWTLSLSLSLSPSEERHTPQQDYQQAAFRGMRLCAMTQHEPLHHIHHMTTNMEGNQRGSLLSKREAESIIAIANAE